MRSRRRERERGITLILVAACIFVFVGIAALAVDVGVLYTARTSAQHAADAGALAGAATFVLQPTAAQPPTATDAAVRIANQNNVLGTPAGITAADVTVDTVNRRVTVAVPRTAARGNAIGLFFARIFGLTSSDLGAIATAEASKSPTGGRCIKPIYIPNTALSQLSDAPSACAAKPSPQIIFDPASGQLSTWAQTLPNQGFGVPIVLKPNSPGGALDPSQYYALDLGSGASTYSCVWASCMSDPACGANQSILQCGSSYPVKTGNMVGPTKQGVDGLICGPSGNCNTDPADTWGGIGDYISPSGTTSSTSRSLTVAPVWDDCSQTINPGTNGQQIKVIGFVEVFVDGVQGNNVVGHVVNPLGCGPGGGGNNSTGPFATPVRLVQAPPAS